MGRSPSALSRRQTSRPSMRGMLMSRTTRSCRSRSTSFSAASPSLASRVFIPALPSAKASNWRIWASSSTRRILWLIAYMSHPSAAHVKGRGVEWPPVAVADIGGEARQVAPGDRPLRFGRPARVSIGPAVPVALARLQPVHDQVAGPAHPLAEAGADRPALELDQRQQGRGIEVVQVAQVERGAAASDLAGVPHVPG